MTEPKRWLDDGAPEVISHMLRAAGDEQPSSRSVERTVAGVAAGAAVTGTASSAAGTALTQGVPFAWSGFLKWTLLGTALSLGAGGLAAKLTNGVASEKKPSKLLIASSPPPAAAPRIPPFGAAQDPPQASTTAMPNPVDRGPSHPPQPPGPGRAQPRRAASDSLAETPVIDAAALAEETKLVDRARAELAAGRARDTLVALDEYQARFPHPRYAPEALYLRMEAWLAAGNVPLAKGVATELATRYPTSPHAARAEAIRAMIP